MSTPHSSRFDDLLPAYALGALDGEDLRELEQHLATGCDECRRQIHRWERDLEALAESVPSVEPSETTRARVLKLASAAPVRRRPFWRPIAAAAAAIALIAIGLWKVVGLQGEVRSLNLDVARLQRELAASREEVRQARQALEVLAAPGVQSVVLAGLGPTPGATGHTYVNPQSRDALFYAFNLPPLARDKTYQLWFIASGKPVSAGTFAVDPRGTASVRVEQVSDVKDIQLWAVTIEPQGGVPQPTGPMVLKG
jgi:anti-sigma-K factor RskA